MIKGRVTWDGTANNMYNDLTGDGNDLSNSFTGITKKGGETWSNFFENLQKEANRGKVIIGVAHSDGRPCCTRGHVVVLMPSSICEGDQRTVDQIGDTIEENVKLPCALEAGGDNKSVKWFAQKTNEIGNYRWFRYEK